MGPTDNCNTKSLFCLLSLYFSQPESPSLLPVEACSVSYVLQIHPVLEKVFHLIPENAIMSGDDFVPGILEPQPDGKYQMRLIYFQLTEENLEIKVHLL